MKINHFGYAVKNIDKSIKDFVLLGYSIDDTEYEDLNRQVKIRFIEMDGIRLELIEPMGEKSPVNDLIKKNGNILYHICYETIKFEDDIQNLVDNGFILIEKPKKAVALDRNKVAFLYKKSVGIVEVVEG